MPISVIMTVDNIWQQLYFMTMTLITDVADVSQGLARVGRGAGARTGGWVLKVAEAADVNGGWLELNSLREMGFVQTLHTERHLLRPFDVLVTARSGRIQVALVPPDVSRTVAGITLLVVHPNRPESGMGHWLLYFLTSAHGQAELAKRITVNSTSFSLSATSLSEVEVPVPAPQRLELMAKLVETTEAVYSSEMRVAQLRRQALRDAIVQDTLQAVKTT